MAKKHLWLARNPEKNSAYLLYLSPKPPKEIPSFWDDTWWFECSYVDRFCKRYFERLNKFRLKPGEYARVKINIELDW